MDRTLIIGVVLGAILAIVGLASAIVCIISYGLDNPLTITFLAVFVAGLLIVGIIWSQ